MRQVFFLFAFLSTIASSPVLSYVFFTFDPLGSVLTTVTGINNSGQIAGNFSDSAGFHAFIRTGTVYTTFEAPGALRTVAGGINSLSQITGNFTDATGSHGYIPSLDGKSFTTFDVLTPRALTIPAAINDKGDVVGTGFSGSGAESFLRTAEGTFTSIRFPLANSTTASGITNTGEVVGTYINGGLLENRHGFLRHPDGTYLNIDVPGIDSTEVTAINSHGEIAGVVQDTHGFVRDSSGAITILDGFGAAQTRPAGINDNGEVAGYTSDRAGIYHGFLAVPGASSTQPEIRPVLGVISASAFGGSATISPGTWIEIYGRNLAQGTGQWMESDFSGDLAPISLHGVTVTINGRAAFVSYISPGQINAQSPSNLQPGQAQVVVNNNGRISGNYQVQVNALQPGLLQLPARIVALTYAAALLPDQSYVLPPGFGFPGKSRRARVGETIAFYGIGFGPVIPDLPAGRIATGLAGLAARIEARFGATPAVVTFAGPSPGFVGLYQINVMVPNGFLAPGQAYDDLAPVSIQLNGSTQVPMLLTAVER